MPTLIQTATGTTYRVPTVKVYLAQVLTGPWTLAPYLRLDNLREATGPEIDQAQLSFHYGPMIREDKATPTSSPPYAPGELNGQYVRIQVEAAVDPAHNFTWHGVIEIVERDVTGGTTPLPADGGKDTRINAGDRASGDQQITALGLLRLLDRVTVRSTVIETATDPQRISRGLAFNLDKTFAGTYYVDRGNRSVSEEIAASTGPDPGPAIYIFSSQPNDGTKWAADEALDYLLNYFPARDGVPAYTTERGVTERREDGTPICKWRMGPQAAAHLHWLDCTAETDGKTVKQILDELIDRRRGLGYKVSYDPKKNTATINTFSVLDRDLTLPSGKTLAAAETQYQLNFEAAYDIASCIVRDLSTTRYDKILVEGAYKTSTCTLTANTTYTQLVPDWTLAEENLYKAGASGDAGYSALDPAEKYRRNAEYRSGDLVAHVYARYRISPEWNQRVYDLDDNPTAQSWWVAPELDADGDPKPLYDAGTNFFGENWYTRGVMIERALALKDRYDYSGTKIEDGTTAAAYVSADSDPQYLPPLSFFQQADGTKVSEVDASTVTKYRYTQLERLAVTAPFESTGGDDDEGGRRWAVHSRILDGSPGLQWTVSGGPQHFLSRSYWKGDLPQSPNVPAATDPRDDPELHSGINSSDLYATLTLRLDSRVSAESILQAAVTGRQQRIKRIIVPDARLDYVVPHTIVQIKNGQAIKSTSGGYVRDDRPRLKDIAAMAARWYSTERQTLTLVVRQLTPLVELGGLVTQFGSNNQITKDNGTKVNTPITAITYDFVAVTTTIETSYADLDFVQ